MILNAKDALRKTPLNLANFQFLMQKEVLFKVSL